MAAELVGRAAWRAFVMRNARSWDELADFPALSPKTQQTVLAKRLLAQVRYFGARDDALPEWREAARIDDPQELWRIWHTLPIITKQTLRQQFWPEDMERRFRLRGLIKSSGGSTGEPTAVFHDFAMVRANNAASLYAQQQMGWRPGMPLIKVWGSERDIGRHTALRSRVVNQFLRIMLVDGYRLGHKTAQTVAALAFRHRPVAIWGFSSMLEFVARSLLETGTILPPGCVHTAWNGGEMLFPSQIELFRTVFGVPILNLYGGRELSAMAFQAREDIALHVLRPWVFVEVVDEEGKTAKPGQVGRLLWTSTVCRGTPFLRYDIGDLGAFDSVDETEAGVVNIRALHGRTAGLLALANGSKVSNLFWNHLFKEMHEVRQFQVALLPDGGVHLRLCGAGFIPAREAELRNTLLGFLGNVPVRISWVDRVPLTAQGKLVQVVREARTA